MIPKDTLFENLRSGREALMRGGEPLLAARLLDVENALKDPSLETTCPFTGKGVSLRTRTFNKNQLNALAKLYWHLLNSNNDTPGVSVSGRLMFVHHKAFADDRNDYSRMKHWGLITPRDTRTVDENATGYWAITTQGVEFLKNTLDIPKSVYIYNDEVWGHSPQRIYARDIDNTFDYAELRNRL